MSSRAAEETGGVLSFTFLDVLTCTMGTLVLLLVVFGERAKQALVADAKARHDAVAATAVESPSAPGAPESGMPAGTAAEQLAAFQKKQAELDKIRVAAAARLHDEQQRVTHLEDHQRRLEHELAQLHFTLERLQEAEKKQSVDQESAKRNLERLTSLISETEEQIEDLRQDGPKRRSFAIVPYKGANGTTRRPIYIECTKEAVVIQPEGIRLLAADFDGPIRSGNPLAAAMRAAREDLNARAVAAGVAEIDLPNPYPLLIVRPNGSAAYAAATSAIGAWDADYGYEFVEADWKLQYPAPDAQLGQVMMHAVEQARQRQAVLAKAAPRRYGSRLTRGGAGPGGGGDGVGDGSGDGFSELAGGGGDRIGQRAGKAPLGASGGNANGEQVQTASAQGMRTGDRYGEQGGASRGGKGRSTGGNFADEFASPSGSGSAGGASNTTAGAAGRGAASDAASGAAAGGAGGSSARAGGSPSSPNAAGRSSMASGGPGQASAGGTSNMGMGAPPPLDVHSAATMAPNDATTAATPSDSSVDGQTELTPGPHSMAEERGSNWANQAATQRASAVTRPIKVIVGPNEMRFLPEGGANPSDATTVTFRQSTDQVMDGLAASVQKQIDEWGLAGRAMYWRPTLVLQVTPGAERQAQRIVELLQDSGVDARLPDVATRGAEGAVYAR